MLLALLITLAADAFLLIALLLQQQRTTNKIMADINQVLADLRALKTSTGKVFTEVRDRLETLASKITELEERLANQTVPDEVATLITEIKAGIQATDELIPDAQPPAEPPAQG